jgi:ProP effector
MTPKQEAYRAAMFEAHNTILAQLVEAFPLAFAPRGKPCWPLKVGIRDDIAAVLPDVAPEDISRFLRMYTNHRRYWKSLKEGAVRRDIFGEPTGEVTADQAQHARELLARSDAKAKPKAAPPAPKAAPAVELTPKKPEPAPAPVIAAPPAPKPKPASTPPAPAKRAPLVVVKKRPLRKTA